MQYICLSSCGSVLEGYHQKHAGWMLYMHHCPRFGRSVLWFYDAAITGWLCNYIEWRKGSSERRSKNIFSKYSFQKSIFNVDDKSMICKYCLKEFSRKEAKLLHEKTCIGPKKFSCNECSKRFKTFQAKIVHEKTHKDKNFHYVCPKCGKCFKYHQNLLRHIKSKKHDYPIGE